MSNIHESASVYNTDEITNTFMQGDHLVVVCKSSIYKIDLITSEVTRLL